MFKKIIAVLSIFVLILFISGCFIDSSTGSSNNPPEASLVDNMDSAFDDFITAANESDSTGDEFFGAMFGTEGFVPGLQFFMNVFSDFQAHSFYNSSENRWEGVVPDPTDPTSEVLLYGEYSDDAFWLHPADAPAGIGVFLYPDTGSVIINIQENEPTEDDPNIRGEFFKSGNYYYGFLLIQTASNYAEIIKFYYEDANPCTEFYLKYGLYIPLNSQNSGTYQNSFTSERIVASDFNINEYDFLKDRNFKDITNDWYRNNNHMDPYAGATLVATEFNYYNNTLR